MATRPPTHKMPRFAAPSHAQQVYDRQTRRMTAHLKCAADVRNSSFWKKVSYSYKVRHPLCEDPHGDHARARQYPPTVDDVHHKIPISKARHLAFVHTNLMSVCKDCHGVFNAQERAEERQ